MTGDSALQRQGASVPGELVARLEAASAGDGLLDADLAILFDGCRRSQNWLLDADGCQFRPDAYTTSLDAALALADRVLPGSDWAIYVNMPGGWVRPLSGTGATVKAATPALALCIAVLKATSANSVGTSAAGGSENQ